MPYNIGKNRKKFIFSRLTVNITDVVEGKIFLTVSNDNVVNLEISNFQFFAKRIKSLFLNLFDIQNPDFSIYNFTQYAWSLVLSKYFITK